MRRERAQAEGRRRKAVRREAKRAARAAKREASARRVAELEAAEERRRVRESAQKRLGLAPLSPVTCLREAIEHCANLVRAPFIASAADGGGVSSAASLLGQPEPENTRVLVGLSGGVDSSTTAFLLREAGFQVEGVYMRNWDELEEQGECSGETDVKDARKLCEHLGIRLHEVNFVKEYWTDVWEVSLRSWAEGQTPNPDILCNREVKFKALFDLVRTQLGADYLATGHYARCLPLTEARQRSAFGTLTPVEKADPDEVCLLSGVDSRKDQSYFLSQISQEALRHTLFPLGALRKTVVRQIAEQAQLHTAQRRDSFGICFVGERKLSPFLSQYLAQKPGNFVHFPDGLVLGQHPGVLGFTVGQRARLSGLLDKHYVVDKHMESNRVYLVPSYDHPSLYSTRAIVDSPDWLNSRAPLKLLQQRELGVDTVGLLECECMLRYQQQLQRCFVELLPDDRLALHFVVPQRAVAVGQTAVLYDGEVCLGGGTIADSSARELFFKSVCMRSETRKEETHVGGRAPTIE